MPDVQYVYIHKFAKCFLMLENPFKIIKNIIFIFINSVSIYQSSFKTLVGILMILNGVHKLKKIVGSNNFSAQFIKIISHYKKIGYNINVLQQTACLVVNPITVGNFAFLFNCTPVGWTSDSMMVPT